MGDGARAERGGLGGMVLVKMAVQGRNTPKNGGGILSLGEIFVAVQTNRDTDFGFGSASFRRRCYAKDGLRRLYDAQNPAAAAHPHTFAQRYLGGHLQCELDFRAFSERHIGKKESSAGAEVLGETKSFSAGGGFVQGDREVVGKALSSTAFHTNRGSSHGRVISRKNRRDKVPFHCSAAWAAWEVTSW